MKIKKVKGLRNHSFFPIHFVPCRDSKQEIILIFHEYVLVSCNLLLCAFLSILFGLVSDEIWLWPTYVNIILQKSGKFWGGLFLLAMGCARGFAFLFQWLIVRNLLDYF